MFAIQPGVSTVPVKARAMKPVRFGKTEKPKAEVTAEKKGWSSILRSLGAAMTVGLAGVASAMGGVPQAATAAAVATLDATKQADLVIQEGETVILKDDGKLATVFLEQNSTLLVPGIDHKIVLKDQKVTIERTNGGPAIQVDGENNCKLQPHMKGRSPIGGVMKRNGKWYGIR